MNIGLFADVSNLYYCLGRKYKQPRLDYTKYKEFCSIGSVVCCHAFGAKLHGNHDFERYLSTNGYAVHFKEPVKFKTPSGKAYNKADCDVALTVEVFRNMDILDTVILGSADSDYEELVRECQNRGKRVIVVACAISKQLRAVADTCIEIPLSMTLDVEALV